MALSLVLNVWNVNFPLGLHNDEPVKIDFINTDGPDFHQPVLMLQLVRAARLVLQPATDQELVVIGRLLIGVAGALSILFTYQLARRLLPAAGALRAAVAAAVSPILVIHAHYLDERTLFTACLLAAVIAFLRLIEQPTPQRVVWAGVATGLAWSSHYLGILLVPLFAAAPLMLRGGKGRPFARTLVQVMALAGCVFMIVNWRLVLDMTHFMTGVRDAAQHAAVGHDVRITWYHYALGFHLLFSLGPGMTWPVALLGVSAAIGTGLRWRHASDTERFVLVTAVTFYLGVELAPLKPWPDFAGYAVPVVPFLTILAVWGATRLVERASRRSAGVVVSAVSAAMLVVYPGYDSVRLVAELSRDTRLRAEAWLRDNPGLAVVESYAGLNTHDIHSVGEIGIDEIRQRGVDYVLVSSFMYDRFAVGSRLSGQDAAVYDAHREYEALLRYPFVEIAPAHRSAAFSNPTIRVVDLRVPASDTAPAAPQPERTGTAPGSDR